LSRGSGKRYCALAAFIFAIIPSAIAQDERRVTSPDGQIDFRIFIATQETNHLSRIAYEMSAHGRQIIKTSFLGLDIQDQEPLLGENVGLTSSSTARSGKYNSLVVKYMQNGSLGRLINVEVRAYDDGVAFRYVIPLSTPLTEILIAEEATEFRLLGKASITESKSSAYPPMHLVHSDQMTMVTRLAHPFQGTTPLTCPWRIIALGPGITADLAPQ
jgi:alpha-glucosidase